MARLSRLFSRSSSMPVNERVDGAAMFLQRTPSGALALQAPLPRRHAFPLKWLQARQGEGFVRFEDGEIVLEAVNVTVRYAIEAVGARSLVGVLVGEPAVKEVDGG